MSNTFCIKLWRSAYVRKDGELRPCCQAPGTLNITETPLPEFWRSDYIETIRTETFTGIQPSICHGCFSVETQGGDSLRKKDNRRFKVFPGKEQMLLNYYKLPKEIPEELEIEVSNLCNLKCIMCSAQYSTSIATEDKILQLGTNNGEIELPSIDWLKDWLVGRPVRLILLGGEPLIIPKVRELFEWAAGQNLLDTLEVMMITNATKVTDYWCDLLSKCKQTYFMVSLEATGKANDYIRFGSDWNTIVNNMEKLRTIPKANVFVHASPSNISIMAIDELIKWCAENSYALDIDPVVGPEIYNIKNLPIPLLQLAKTRLEAVRMVNSDAVEQLTKVVDHAICNSTFDTHWIAVQNDLKPRDRFRKTSLVDVLPEFAPYWDKD